MNLNDLIGKDVVDSNGQDIGKVEDVDIDSSSGISNYLVVKLKKGLFSKAHEKIKYEDIKNIKDVVLLKIILKK